MKFSKLIAVLCTLALSAAAAGCSVSDQPLSSDPTSGISSAQNDSANDGGSDSKPAGQDSAANNGADNGGDGITQQGDDTPVQQQGGSQDNNGDTPAAADIGSDPYKVGSEPTLSIGVVKAKPGQKNVPVSVKVTHNPGFAVGGIRVIYDAALTPKYDPETEEGVSDPGPAAGKAMTYCAVGPENRIVAFGILGSSDCTADGIIFTCYFDVPDNASSGSVYKLETGVERLVNANSDPIDFKLVGGEIRIE